MNNLQDCNRLHQKSISACENLQVCQSLTDCKGNDLIPSPGSSYTLLFDAESNDVYGLTGSGRYLGFKNSSAAGLIGFPFSSVPVGAPPAMKFIFPFDIPNIFVLFSVSSVTQAKTDIKITPRRPDETDFPGTHVVANIAASPDRQPENVLGYNLTSPIPAYTPFYLHVQATGGDSWYWSFQIYSSPDPIIG